MQIAMIGLGAMGGSMARRLVTAGHTQGVAPIDPAPGALSPGGAKHGAE
jgi:3-hydroxyisobutyrate dehydrogenase-like beta-hydroxyacid dehydrogenase